MPQLSFESRVYRLADLGLGVSTEYGARSSSGGLDPHRLRREHPEFGEFLEVGIEADKGLDGDAKSWSEAGLPCTYHFLDINLHEPEDFDEAWLARVQEHVATLKPAWLCGDAGLWHFGRRERGHMLLLPPVLCRESARAMARGIEQLREATGLEVLPENPPGDVFLGDMHILDFFAEVCELADTGMLLDCAHLAIYQRAMGHAPDAGLDGFDLSRVVEMHVAGARQSEIDGFAHLVDDHTPEVLPETWSLFEALAPACRNLKAVVFECERNPLEDCLPGFRRIAATLEKTQRLSRRVSRAAGPAGED